MKKPAWVSFFGWAFLFSVGMLITAMVSSDLPRPQAWVAVVVPFSMLIAGPSLFIWVVGSIWWSFQRKGAELQAAAIAEGIRQAQARGGDANLPGPRRVMTSPLNLTGTDKR